MKRRNITPEENAKNIFFNPNTGLRHTVLRDPSIVDEFYLEECSPSDDKDVSYSVVDPIIILFNQQRLDNMGATAVKNFLDSLQSKSNSLAELRQNCSDEDLMELIKSRHLQSHAEILSWCRYMQDNVDKFNAAVAEISAQQIEQTEKITESETITTS